MPVYKPIFIDAVDSSLCPRVGVQEISRCSLVLLFFHLTLSLVLMAILCRYIDVKDLLHRGEEAGDTTRKATAWKQFRAVAQGLHRGKGLFASV